jgi:hypothetical protein
MDGLRMEPRLMRVQYLNLVVQNTKRLELRFSTVLGSGVSEVRIERTTLT